MESKLLCLILIRLSQISSIIPVICGLLYFKNLDKTFKSLVWILLFFVGVEIFSFSLTKSVKINLPLYHIFTVLEFVLLYFVFNSYFQFSKKVNILVVGLFGIVALLDAFLLHSLTTFNGIVKPLECIILTVLALYFYYNSLNKNLMNSIFKQPMFWFSTSIFIYFSLNFFKFLLMNFFMEGVAVDIKYLHNNVHSLTNITANLLYSIAFISFKWDR